MKPSTNPMDRERGAPDDVASGSAEPPTGESVAPRRARRWFFVLLGLVVTGGILTLVLRGKDDVQVETKPDVPHAEGAKIAFSEKFAKRVGVKWTKVERAELNPVITVVGTVDFDPEHVAAVGTRLKGLVRRVSKFEGDGVDAGEVMAEIDSAELGEAQAAVTMIKAEQSAAIRNAEREKSLSDRNLSTDREYELAATSVKEHATRLQAAKQKVHALGGTLVPADSQARLGVQYIRSPLAGTVVERHVYPGQSVEGHLVAFKVANLDHVWVNLAVFERSLPGIAVGDAVSISPLAATRQHITGRVAHVGAQIDPATRSADVRVEIDNRERKLRPGQAVNATIRVAKTVGGDATMVPKDALTFLDGKPIVFVRAGPNSVLVSQVELGADNGKLQQVIRGLKAGQEVVVGAVFALKTELFR